MPAYKPVFIFRDDERAENAQVFATYNEAMQSAASRFQRWTMPTGYEVRETDDPITYAFVDGKDVSLHSYD